ncbi:MAG: 5'/3'-nucleotidase SurE [Paracoccaceae bacterium]|jgi:5'-nucleotidase
MKILITNDDGIQAPGLQSLIRIAQNLTDPSNIWVVAPMVEQSGVGHCISYTAPMRVHQTAPQSYAIQGYPADCVIAGLHEIAKEVEFDVVLSGVNAGNNSAENAAYSGTLGAAMEAALQGQLGIAVSQFFGPNNKHLANPYEAAEANGAALIRAIIHIDKTRDTAAQYRSFYNVNIPPVAANDVKGHRVVPQGRRPTGGMQSEAQTSPSGRKFIWIKGAPQHDPGVGETDVAVNVEGYISVTPMRADFTDYTELQRIAAQL